MATYVYETIPKKKGQKARQFEYVQSMTEPALTHDPKTGEPVRRVIIGGSVASLGCKTAAFAVYIRDQRS